MADSGKFSKLYLVDLFKGVASSGDKTGRNIKTYPDASVLYEHNVNRFKQYNFVEIIKSTSIDFLNSMTNMLDFVYIDTVHTYEYTILELNSAYNAVKTGGIISGHDYNEQQYSGLVRAVKEFCDRYNLSVYLTNQDTLESFVIVKT